MSLKEYFDNADLQVETADQKAEIIRALGHIVELPPERLAEQRYSDYEGTPEQWTLMKIVNAYFYSAMSPSLSEENFLQELTEYGVRNRIDELVTRMLANCVHHPGRPSTGTVFGKSYCQKCNDGIAVAVSRVDKHVEPKACFVIYKGSDTWDPISGTGCAHWVAHQRGISRGEKCLDGKTLRVPDLTNGLTKIPRANVVINDIWANDAEDHCGLVIKVQPKAGSPPNIITIRHDSSDQGGVKENDFDSHFKAKGTFNR